MQSKSNNDLNELLKTAAQTLGMQNQTTDAAANAQLGALLQKLNPQDIARLSGIISNKAALEKLLMSEEGQKLIKQLGIKKDGGQ